MVIVTSIRWDSELSRSLDTILTKAERHNLLQVRGRAEAKERACEFTKTHATLTSTLTSGGQ